jgi:hypothetical protein
MTPLEEKEVFLTDVRNHLFLLCIHPAVTYIKAESVYRLLLQSIH